MRRVGALGGRARARNLRLRKERPRAARSVGDTRKPLHRPSGALMPCFPGCLGWNDARYGGERAKTTYATSTLAMSRANGTAFVGSICKGADVGLWAQFQKQNAADHSFYAGTFGPTPETQRHAGADHRP
jgi:hypothetical protein